MNDNNFYNRYELTPNNNNNNQLQNKVQSVNNQLQNISNRYGADFYNALGGLYSRLTNKKLDVDKVLDTVDILNKIKADMTKRYLYSLLFPEKSKGARIPTKFPVPSTTFQQTDFVLVTPNASGNFILQWCPQNLSSSTSNNEIVLNVASTLTGNNTDTTYTTQSSLMNSLVTNWQAFRVVSACLVVQYVGSYVNLQGVFGGGLDISASTSNSYDSNYSVFSNIDDRLWSQTTRVDEGLKIVYFPKDYNDLSFIKPNTTPASNNLASTVRLMVYGQNLPASVQCVRIDIIKNVEAIPGPAFADIMDCGYLESESMVDHSLEASKILTKSNLVVTRMDEQDPIEKTLKSPGNDYMEVLNDKYLMNDKKSRADGVKEKFDKVRNENNLIDRRFVLPSNSAPTLNFVTQ